MNTELEAIQDWEIFKEQAGREGFDVLWDDGIALTMGVHNIYFSSIDSAMSYIRGWYERGGYEPSICTP